jgi:hypothetical protein
MKLRYTNFVFDMSFMNWLFETTILYKHYYYYYYYTDYSIYNLNT